MTRSGSDLPGLTLPSFSGDLRIYSAPRALVRHINWSLNQIFGSPIDLDWRAQRLAVGSLATEYQWRGEENVASVIASTLKSWHYLRFEVREFPTEGGEGVLYRCTPELGLHQAVTASTGDIMIHENRLITTLNSHRSYESLREGITAILGTAWDVELERYRLGSEESEIYNCAILTS
ncbi:MAG: DUF3145 family protein [Actinomycetes bacterium]